MCKLKRNLIGFSTALVWFAASSPAMAQYGAAVVSYDAGTTPAPGFTTASAAVGEPERFTGEGVFPGVVSPFSPPFLSSEIVSIGEGGHITLRLSHYAIPQAGPEIGVFENVGIIFDPGTGGAGSPVATFGEDSATIEVSADGVLWSSLGPVAFNLPASGYTDLSDPFSGVPGSVPSDFQQPFVGQLSDFAGLPYSDAGPDVLDVLAGSGGGTWLDISTTALARVGYIRFSVAPDLTPGVNLNFELDAVSIAHGAVGGVVPEPSSALLACLGVAVSRITLGRRPQRAKRE